MIGPAKLQVRFRLDAPTRQALLNQVHAEGRSLDDVLTSAVRVYLNLRLVKAAQENLLKRVAR